MENWYIGLQKIDFKFESIDLSLNQWVEKFSIEILNYNQKILK
jgi:hypothetical protein